MVFVVGFIVLFKNSCVLYNGPSKVTLWKTLLVGRVVATPYKNSENLAKTEYTSTRSTDTIYSKTQIYFF
jgi:hypothetical protein